MGELHLEIALDRLNREYGVPVRLGEVMVAYRESLPDAVDADNPVEHEVQQRFARARVAIP